MNRMNRRTFLQGSGALGATALVGATAACSTGGNKSATTTTSGANHSTTSSSSSSSTSTPSGPPNWKTLAAMLTGTLVVPTDANYTASAQLFNELHFSSPAAIAYCATSTDVQRCIGFAREHKVALAARSGGHSYAGYSSCPGLVVDVSSMRQVTPNTTTAQAVVGAGAHLIDIYGQLSAAGVLIPGGSCPTVGITGLALGGGIGVLGRAYGMTCDNIDSLQMVTADGVLRTCSPNQHEDLYWASRGGGGGNFGVVTSFTFKTHPIPAINLFTLEWAWGDAGAVLESWMQWLSNTPKELWSNCQLDSNGSAGGGVVKVTGVFAGPTAACASALAPLLSAVGSTPSYQFVGPEDYFRAMTIEGGCEGESVSQCDAVTRSAFVAKSSYINAALSGSGVSSIIDAISSLATTVPSVGGGIVFDGYGGVINDVAADATAFVHRAAVACAQYSVTYGSANPPDSVAAGVTSWLNETQTRFAPYTTGSYQNYIDPTLKNWADAYYGSNLPRLSQIKRKWDPDDYFHFAQSIPLST